MHEEKIRRGFIGTVGLMGAALAAAAAATMLPRAAELEPLPVRSRPPQKSAAAGKAAALIRKSRGAGRL